MSRKEVAKLLRAGGHKPPKNTVIISIRNSDQYRLHRDCDDILNLQFDDMLENDPMCMTKQQAALVVNFATKAANEGRDIIVHCHGGVSRSAGCAAAIIAGLNAKSIPVSPSNYEDIWLNPKYVPNEFVFQLVTDAFGIHFSESEITELKHRNAEAFFKRHADEF